MRRIHSMARHTDDDCKDLDLKCPKGCQMKKVHGKPASYLYGAICDKCDAPDLQNLENFYHCDLHEHDLCRVCALQQANILKKSLFGNSFTVKGHKCELTYDPKS